MCIKHNRLQIMPRYKSHTCVINWVTGSLMIGFALMLNGCGRYKLTLPHVTKQRAHYVKEKVGVEVLARALSRDELCAIIRKPYAVPSMVGCALLTVCNHTKQTVTLDKALVGLPLLSPGQVKELLAYDGGVGPAVAGYVLVPLAVGGLGACLLSGFIAFPALVAGVFILSVPFLIIDGVAYFSSTQHDLRDFIDCYVLSKMTVPSGETCSVLLFTHGVINSPFSFEVLSSVRSIRFMVQL